MCMIFWKLLNPLCTNPAKWSKALKQFVSKSPQIVGVCLTILSGWFLRVKTLTWEKNVRKRYYFYPGITIMKLWLTLKHNSMQTKSCLNYFALKMILLNILRNFAIYLFWSFALHIMIISQNDTFLYCRTNHISLHFIILRNAFLAPEYIK